MDNTTTDKAPTWSDFAPVFIELLEHNPALTSVLRDQGVFCITEPGQASPGHQALSEIAFPLKHLQGATLYPMVL